MWNEVCVILVLTAHKFLEEKAHRTFWDAAPMGEKEERS